MNDNNDFDSAGCILMLLLLMIFFPGLIAGCAIY